MVEMDRTYVDLEITGVDRLSGMARGTVTVRRGGHLDLTGFVASLIVDQGGSCEVTGIVERIQEIAGDVVFVVGCVLNGRQLDVDGKWHSKWTGSFATSSNPRFRMEADGSLHAVDN